VLQAASHATSASSGVEVLPCKCLGKCKQAPVMRVRAEGEREGQLSVVYTQVGPVEVPGILDQQLC
jgi:(2Fe-2S) ferredoxin